MENKGYNRSNEWAKKKRQEELANNPDAIECLICGNKYLQVGSHIVQVHGMTARQYREKFGLDVKRGLTKGEYRKKKAETTLVNGTYKNLEAGKKFWFKKGQTITYKRSPQTLERLKGGIKHKLDNKENV